MKLNILAAAIMLAGSAIGMQAQTPDEIRVYINPGHGSWTVNDRPMDIIGKPTFTAQGTDTTTFFESNTNLFKGFGMLEKLIEMGVPFDRTLNQEGERWEIGAARDLEQNLVMSRVKNGPYSDNNTGSAENAEAYNRSLYEIAAEVEQNDFDIFVSIHSNASSTANTNYHVYLYRGHDPENGGEGNEGSYAMCEAAAKYSYDNPHAAWTVDYAYIRGDVDFYHSGSENGLGYYGYLGVIKHGVPGYLVEGFFHTHGPSRHRAMNWDVDVIEGYQYARGVAEYFEFEERDATGDIYGIARDKYVRFDHPLYAIAVGDDVQMPINGVKAILWKNGEKIQECVTDQFYNGTFVFKQLEPGTYQLTFEHEAYAEIEPVDVEVVAGLTSYPKIYLTDKYYFTGEPGEDINFPNLVSADVANLADSYEIKRDYIDIPVAELAGKTPKRMIWMKDKLYVLAHNADSAATVVVIDPTSCKVLANVSTSACTGQLMNLSDIAVTADGTLIACSKSKNQHEDKYVDEGETRGEINFFKWANDANGVPTGEAELWFASQNAGTWYRAYVGDTFAYAGTMDKGTMIVSAINTNASTNMRYTAYTIVNGENNPDLEQDSRPSRFNSKDLGESFLYSVSPIDRHQIFVSEMGEKYGMRQYDQYHEISATASAETPDDFPQSTIGTGFFRFADQSVMTLASTDSDLRMFNISEGIAAPKEIKLGNVAIEGTATKALSTGYPIANLDESGNVVSGDFAIMVLRDDKLSRFTTGEIGGIGNISIDKDLPVIYYDLNGHAVNASTLMPGIYIRLQGTEATKVIVK